MIIARRVPLKRILSTKSAYTRFGDADGKRTRTHANLVRAPVRVEGTLLQRAGLIAEARSLVLYNLLGHVRRGRSARLNRSQRPAFVEEMKRIHDAVPRSRGIEEQRNSRCKFPESLSFSSFFFSSVSLSLSPSLSLSLSLSLSFSLSSCTLAPPLIAPSLATSRGVPPLPTSEEGRR